MSRKGIPDEAAAQVLDRFTDVGLVCDESVARTWVENRRRERHLGRRALAEGLRRKGIDPDLVDRSLSTVTAEDERESATALARSRVRGMSGLDPAVQQRRLAGLLARRGFPPGIVYAVVREVLGELGSDPPT